MLLGASTCEEVKESECGQKQIGQQRSILAHSSRLQAIMEGKPQQPRIVCNRVTLMAYYRIGTNEWVIAVLRREGKPGRSMKVG